jgi:hydrogenase maturation protease
MCSAATTESTLPGAAASEPAELPPVAASTAAPPIPAPGAAGPGVARRTLVVGLGNPLLGDDGVGWRVVDLVEARLAERSDEPVLDGGPAPAFEVDRLAVGGLALMERLVGYERAILVDAIETGVDPPGTVRVAELAEVLTRAASHLDSSHDAPLTTALAAGRSLGADLPATVTVVTVEAERLGEFDERLTPVVGAAVWPAADAVLGLLMGRDP